MSGQVIEAVSPLKNFARFSLMLYFFESMCPNMSHQYTENIGFNSAVPSTVHAFSETSLYWKLWEVQMAAELWYRESSFAASTVSIAHAPSLSLSRIRTDVVWITGLLLTQASLMSQPVLSDYSLGYTSVAYWSPRTVWGKWEIKPAHRKILLKVKPI